MHEVHVAHVVASFLNLPCVQASHCVLVVFAHAASCRSLLAHAAHMLHMAFATK